ncbi:MAG: glycosyltransferase [Planctomycetaceae bacterium]|nr:glycosyltransferase [Planctomycetaceae bacterium]
MPKCIIVVPCYNERWRLDAAAFRALIAVQPNVDFLFVNDGSTDGTGELLDTLRREPGERFRVLHLERNGGKAEAVRRGLLHAEQIGALYAGYWDADLATPLEAIPEFVAHLDAHPDVLIAFGARVRLLGCQIERRLARHYLGRIFATFVSLLFGVPVYDTQCGAKLFRMIPEVVRLFEAPFRSRWIFDVEILARFLRDRRDLGVQAIDAVIHEIPLLRWKDVAGSKVKPRDFLKAFFELWTIRRGWLRAEPVPARPAASRPGSLRPLPGHPRTEPCLSTAHSK